MPSLTQTAFLALILINGATGRAAETLQSPWDSVKITLTDAPYTCPPPRTVPKNLVMDGFYRLDDPTHSIVDPVRQAAYNKASEDVKGAGQEIVAAGDAFRKTGSRAAGRCVISLTSGLVAQDSMAGKMSSGQAYYVQGWVAGAIAIANLKVRGYGLETPDYTAPTAAWLKIIAEQTKGFYEVKTKNDGNRNNHYYWAGIEIAAIGVFANDRRDWDWGMKSYAEGVDRIQPDGTLPLEMKRGARALHYHLYALAPLVYLAEFGEANGIPMYTRDKSALSRLVNVSIHGLSDPSLFERETGVKQEVPAQPSGDQIGWAPPYIRRFPDPTIKALVDNASTLSIFYLGGLPPP